MKGDAMGTWTTDILGQGLAHTRPLTRKERVREAQIKRRWNMWQPLLLHELRLNHRSEVYTELRRLKGLHAAAMCRCLDAGIRYQVISQSNRVERVDDPRMSDVDRDTLIADMLRRGAITKEMHRAKQS